MESITAEKKTADPSELELKARLKSKETLEKQLELLSKASEECVKMSNHECLPNITHAMIEITHSLYNW